MRMLILMCLSFWFLLSKNLWLCLFNLRILSHRCFRPFWISNVVEIVCHIEEHWFSWSWIIAYHYSSPIRSFFKFEWLVDKASTLNLLLEIQFLPVRILLNFSLQDKGFILAFFLPPFWGDSGTVLWMLIFASWEVTTANERLEAFPECLERPQHFNRI